MQNSIAALRVTSPAFSDGGVIPKRHTGFGQDVSPSLILEGLREDAASLAVTMDDLDIPVLGSYNHWTIWNLPPCGEIPEAIPHGAELPSLNGARQGVGYGKHCYRGPKQPVFIRNTHRYVFTVYALDTRLALDTGAGKRELLQAMEGHILQQGSILGIYRR